MVLMVGAVGVCGSQCGLLMVDVVGIGAVVDVGVGTVVGVADAVCMLLIGSRCFGS
jgi:hypothetical protein